MGCNCNKQKTTLITSTNSSVQSQTIQQEEKKSERIQSHILSDTDPLYLQRVDICNSCEYRDAVKERCMKCGCFIKAKSRLRFSSCPLPEPRW
jgi:hypothetical protein